MWCQKGLQCQGLSLGVWNLGTHEALPEPQDACPKEPHFSQGARPYKKPYAASFLNSLCFSRAMQRLHTGKMGIANGRKSHLH